ncbi:unnamed protein product [Oppiella nova]|uniref:Elongation of very long chain fatty acids protein n=1 Tax=Oppiella nova TaxID=334625 RepID=A0A7R9M916_9ACAR|nr:unnamed protein product [Oppiella nova]CAG2171718.1 unnamed protein product [Oppiella nova]
MWLELALDRWIVGLLSWVVGRDSFLFYWLHEYWEQGIDPRTRGYFLVDMSPLTLCCILAIYIIHVKLLIPYLMKNRKPFDLKKIIIGYDVLLVAINAYFWFYSLAHITDMWDFRNPKTDTSDKAMKFINTAHLYYLSKWFDLLDTYFMALKKKNSHISVLHYITRIQLVQMATGIVWMSLVLFKSTDLPYWEQGVDPRTRGYFLVDWSNITMGSVMFTYIFHVTILIPYLMKNRKPFDLKKIIIAYDVLLVAINAYFWFYALGHIADMWDFRNPKTDTSDKAIKFMNTAHLYYLSKLIDLLDTYFMALKKKNSHISVLHVWHHISVPWAALGPQYQKYLWWKRYITQMQLVQMTIGIVWFTLVYIKSTDIPVGYLACNLGNATALKQTNKISFSMSGITYQFQQQDMPTEYMFPLLNGFIHVVMYGYYALAALGPQYQKYLWWKKYITQMQLIQMTIAFVWFNLVYLKSTDIPAGYHASNIGNATALFLLFLNFYIQAYRKENKQIKTQ